MKINSLWYRYKNKQLHISPFRLIVLIVSITTLFVISLLLTLLWQYLSAYENNSPVGAINKYIGLMIDGKFDEAVQLVGLEYDYFNDVDAYATHLANLFGNDFQSVSINKIGSEKNELEYGIYLKNRLVNSIMLTPNDKIDRFRLHGWNMQVTNVRAAHTAKITVPKDAIFYINGKVVSRDFITHETQLIHAYNSQLLLESGKDFSPIYEVYAVDGLLNAPELSVSFGDEMYEITNISSQNALALPKITPDKTNEYTQIAMNAAKKFAGYSMNKVGYKELEGLFVPKSLQYIRMKEYFYRWSEDHEWMITSLDTDNLKVYDDRHFSVNVNLKHTIKRDGYSYPYEVRYKMYFIKQSETWQIAKLVVIPK